MDIVITPGEKNVIEETPTLNVEAYSYFQRAREAVLRYQMDPDYLDTDLIKVASLNFRKTLALDSTFSQAYSGLALCYLFNNVFYSLSSNVIKVDSLLDLIEKAIMYDEHNAEAYFARSGYYVFMGDSEKALRECDVALKYNPNYWEVYYSKATVLYRWNYKKGNLVKALDNIKTAINLNSGKNLSSLLNEFGNTLGGFGGFNDEAEILYRKAFSISNDSGTFYMNLATMEINKGNLEKSIEYNIVANRIDTTNYEGILTISQTYNRTNQYDKAIASFRKVIKHFERTGNVSKPVLHRIAYAYWRAGDKKKAMVWFNKAIEINTRSIKKQDWDARVAYNSYYDLAGIYAFLGNKRKALENLEVFNQVEICPNWMLNLIKADPMFEKIRNEPRFIAVVADLETKYQSEHQRIAEWLKYNRYLLE